MSNRASNRFAYNCLYGLAIAGATSPAVAWSDVRLMRTSPRETYDSDTPIAWQNSLLRSIGQPYDAMIDCVPSGGSGSSSLSVSRTWYEAASFRPFELEVRFAFSVSDSLAHVRSSLSLQIKELAKILGVERPTVYAWLRDEAKPQPKNKTRLIDLLRMANEWDKLSVDPVGKQVRDALNEKGESLVDLLADEMLNHGEIRSLMHELLNHQKHPSKRTIRDVATKYGLDTSGVRQSQAEFDVLTGKRAHEG